MGQYDCKQHILSTLYGDLAIHPIPNLEIKITPQRPPEEFSESYYMFGVATNILGEVDCDLQGGKSVFPFEWKASNGKSYTIPDVEVQG